VARFPTDLDAAVLYAEALMDLRPWNYWAEDGRAHPGVNDAVARLEGVLRRNPDHPGACHYYIHLVEASPAPERALACAQRLAGLMPGAGHLVHMPAHIYIRLGMYAEAAEANVHAAHTDETYIADARPDGIYAVAYYPHNLHFLWAVAAFQGRRADAADAIRRLKLAAPTGLAVRERALEIYVLPTLYHLVWFEQWDAVLREPRPAPELLVTTGLWHYARGRALAATGRNAEARSALDSLAAIQRDAPSRLPPGITLGFAPPAAILDLAQATLTGAIAAGERRWDDAVAALHLAVARGDSLTYNEPADWYPSPRLTLGTVLHAAGRAAAAEAVYRADLERNRNSGWALTGLERALTAQGKTAEAAVVRERLGSWGR
jgi:tetratricopeptide (TPR) repeat protein